MSDIKIVTHYETFDEACCKDYLSVTIEVDGTEVADFGPRKYSSAEDAANLLLKAQGNPEQRMRFKDINDGRIAT